MAATLQQRLATAAAETQSALEAAATSDDPATINRAARLRQELVELASNTNAELVNLLTAFADINAVLVASAAATGYTPMQAASLLGFGHVVPTSATASSYGRVVSQQELVACVSGTATATAYETAAHYDVMTGDHVGPSAFAYVDRSGKDQIARGEWVEARLSGPPMYVVKYALSRYGSPSWQPCAPCSWLLLGSNDGERWEEIDTRAREDMQTIYSSMPGTVLTVVFHVAPATVYSRLRFVVSSVGRGATTCVIGALRFDGHAA